jgi:hypothetical protein
VVQLLPDPGALTVPQFPAGKICKSLKNNKLKNEDPGWEADPIPLVADFGPGSDQTG